MDIQNPAGPTAFEWANHSIQVKKIEHSGTEAIYELRKEMVINGVLHRQFVWLNQSQLRSIGIDHGL